jgi:hypothetical protein
VQPEYDPQKDCHPFFFSPLTSHQQIRGEYDVEGRHAHTATPGTTGLKKMNKTKMKMKVHFPRALELIYSFAFGWSSGSSTFANW